MSKSVVFIHGTWLTPAIWQHFQGRFAACGYHCCAPAWPQGESRGIAALVTHYRRYLLEQATPPLLVGHDLGATLVQLLLDQGLGQAGIAIAPLRRGLVGLRSTWPWLLGGFSSCAQRHMTARQFARTMAQTLTTTDQVSEYARHIVPAPARLFIETALGIGNHIDFTNHQRAPLLLIAGGKDRLVPARQIASLYRHHRRSSAPTSFRAFTGYSHWLIAEPGWEAIADYCIEWAQDQLGPF
ncbi:alpha/beta hydrolase [Pseudomonas sp. SH1-B]